MTKAVSNLKMKNTVITLICILVIVFLFFVNVGLNISGPAQAQRSKDDEVYSKIQKRFPLVQEVSRHNFKYVTYSAVINNKVYIFDYEGGLVIEKPFSEEKIQLVTQKINNEYGIENANVQIGYGYENVVLYVEEGSYMIYFDYDTLETVFYHRGDLV